MFRKLLCLLSLSAALSVTAQTVNQAVTVSDISLKQFPGQVSGIWSHDGTLHFAVGDMLFVANDVDGVLSVPAIDTTLAAFAPGASYSVSSPTTGSIFFTADDKNGVSRLFEYYEKKPGKWNVRRVKPSGFSFSIEHPVFTADGGTMVFASDCPIGFGGLDLWYSRLHNGEWQYPQNMGHYVNTGGNECYPALYGDFLVFSSDGRNGRGGYDLYASRLVALEQTGDTVMMYPIGRSQVHSLGAPFCSDVDDIAFSVDNAGHGWWLSHDTVTHSVALHSFSSRLDCISLSGIVRGNDSAPVAGAEVVVRDADGKEYRALSDSSGLYNVFLIPSVRYELAFHASEHFVERLSVAYERAGEGSLYDMRSIDIALQGFVLGSRYRFDDLFLTSVSSELSRNGRERLAQLARFLNENEGLTLTIESAYNLSEDRPFCSLLNQSRLRSVTDYLRAQGVPLSSLTSYAADVPPLTADSTALSSAAVSSRTLSFVFSRK